MARIGNYGTEHQRSGAELDTIGWFGADIRVDVDGSDLALLDFIENATSVDEKDPAAFLIVKRFLREVIYDDDFAEFWRLARKHKQNTMDLMQVAAEIVQHATGRPIRPSSDSSSGPVSTAAKSKDGSYSRAMNRLSGRPDLQLAVVRSQEAQEAQEARRAG